MEIRVDLRVELMSVVFHLANHPEYEAFDTPYRRAVDQHFDAFRDHDAVRGARDLRASHGISYNAPIGLAVFLDEKTLLPAVRLDDATELDARWRGVAIGMFLGYLREFAIQSRAAAFFTSQQGYMRQVVERLTKTIAEQELEKWFAATFSHVADISGFVVVPGLLTGPWNYEAATHDACGRRSVFQIVELEGVDPKGLPTPSFTTTELVTHETAHAFVNPIVERHEAELAIAAAPLFEAARPAMEHNHYTTPIQLVEEMIVRAITALFTRDRFGREIASQLVRADLQQGFAWNVELAKWLDAKPRPFDLAALMPEIGVWLRDVAPGLSVAR